LAKQDHRSRSIRFYLFRIANRIQKSDFCPRKFRPFFLRSVGLHIGSVRIQTGVDFLAGDISIDDGAYINTGTLFESAAPIKIGRNVYIAPRVNLITATHKIGSEKMRAGDRAPAPITIDDGVWIGTAATILPGVSIAKGCIIAAGAVVTRSTAPNGLYAGVPARRMRDLPVGQDEALIPDGAIAAGG
jgi:maltose O-acetyltransferase